MPGIITIMELTITNASLPDHNHKTEIKEGKI